MCHGQLLHGRRCTRRIVRIYIEKYITLGHGEANLPEAAGGLEDLNHCFLRVDHGQHVAHVDPRFERTHHHVLLHTSPFHTRVTYYSDADARRPNLPGR